MENKNSGRSFWNRYAKLYDLEIRRFNRAAYAGKLPKNDKSVVQTEHGGGARCYYKILHGALFDFIPVPFFMQKKLTRSG